VLREFEATDSTGNLYELPIGNIGDTKIFKLQNAYIGDFNADGAVTAADVQISTIKATVQWINRDSGTFQIGHLQAVTQAGTFTVTYRSEHYDATTVTLRSPSDPTGFTLSLRESTPISHTFTATFKTGATTATAGANDATSATRPVIKVVDGDTVTLEYADASPAKLISEAVMVDAIKPSVSITSPTHLSSTSNATAWARVVVTDAGSGVELSQIKFHVDVDRDQVFDEPGEIITPSAADSVAINQGWNAIALLPPSALTESPAGMSRRLTEHRMSAYRILKQRPGTSTTSTQLIRRRRVRSRSCLGMPTAQLRQTLTLTLLATILEM
jgi:hypothetical protein